MSVGTLSALFESALGDVFRREQLLDLAGGDLEAAVAAGLLHEDAAATESVCTDCGEAHFVSVEWSAARGAHGRYCANGGGWAEVPAEGLRRYSFDHRVFLAELARKFGAKGQVEPLIEGACWRLGTLSLDSQEALLVAARELYDPRRLLETAQALKRFKEWRGLVICGAHPGIDLGLLPKHLKLWALDDLVSLSEEGGVTVNLAAVEEALGLRRRGRGEHGASSDHPNLIARIEERFRAGKKQSSAAAEADELLIEKSWARRDRPLPKRKTLARFVARRWDRLATK